MRIKFIVLHPRHGVCNAVAILLFVGECACDDIVVHAQRTAFEHLLSAEQGIYCIYVFVRCSHLYPRSAVLLAEFTTRLIPPVMRVGHRLGVILAEYYEIMFYSIAFTYCHQ